MTLKHYFYFFIFNFINLKLNIITNLIIVQLETNMIDDLFIIIKKHQIF